MKKSTRNILIGIVVLVVAMLLVFHFFPGISPFTIFSPGCVFIPNNQSPDLSYTTSTTDSSYKCTGGDECIVWGSMDVNKQSTSSSKVIFRTNAKVSADYKINGTWIAINCIPSALTSGTYCPITNELHGYCYSITSSGTINDRNKIGNTPTGEPIYSYNSNMYIGVSSTSSRQYKPCTTAELSTTPVELYKSNGQEIYSGQIAGNYQANFNFCPVSDPNNAYCNKLYSGTSAGTVFTSSNPQGSTSDAGAPILSKDATINFAPSYSDQSLGTVSHTLYIAKCDKSCSVASNTCVAGTQQCQQCPTGTVITQKGKCAPSYWSDVGVEPYTSYLTCTGTHSVGNYGATCPWWNTQTTDCNVNGVTNNKCLLGTTGTTTGVGIGSCRCGADECGSNQIKVNADGTWQTCKQTTSGCWYWDVTLHSCASGLKFDGKKCICDSANPNACDPSRTSTRCNGNGFQSCLAITISDAVFGNINCSRWSSNTQSCGDGQICTNGQCVCDSTQCASGTIKCDGSDKYIPCQIASGDVCRSFNNPSIPVGTGQQCINNKLETLPGCTYTTPCGSDYDCINNICTPKTTGDYCTQGTANQCLSNTQFKQCTQIATGIYKWVNQNCLTGQKCVSNQCIGTGCGFGDVVCDTANFEVCTNNACVCTQDASSCTLADYTNLNTRCKTGADIIQNCIKHGNCYRWEDGEICGNNMYCGEI